MGRREHRKWMANGVEHHPSCDVNMRRGRGGTCTCEDEDRKDIQTEKAKRAPVFSHRAIHALAILDQMKRMGEPITNEQGHHVGLTYTRLIELLQELDGYRKADPLHEPLIRTLNSKSEEIAGLQRGIGRLRDWIMVHTKIRHGLDNGHRIIDQTIYLLDKSRSALLVQRATVMADWEAAHRITVDEASSEVVGLSEVVGPSVNDIRQG